MTANEAIHPVSRNTRYQSVGELVEVRYFGNEAGSEFPKRQLMMHPGLRYFANEAGSEIQKRQILMHPGLRYFRNEAGSEFPKRQLMKHPGLRSCENRHKVFRFLLKK